MNMHTVSCTSKKQHHSNTNGIEIFTINIHLTTYSVTGRTIDLTENTNVKCHTGNYGNAICFNI